MLSDDIERDERLRYPAASALLGISVGTLQSMVCRKQVPHYRFGKRLVVFSRTELITWMNERQVRTSGDPR